MTNWFVSPSGLLGEFFIDSRGSLVNKKVVNLLLLIRVEKLTGCPILKYTKAGTLRVAIQFIEE